jgi:methylphosphotriester-DNA--protein-cysteine methyltransferase
MIEDPDRCYAAVTSRDPRFDGWFVVGVTSTGIYCRPSCPARTPLRANVRFFATAATAQAAGFRACRRCRPDASPGSPAWDQRADLVGRAMRLIADGVVDRDGVAGLARRLGYSERHLHRQLMAELGVGPQALARAQRAQTARVLIEGTDLPFGEVAFAAGFASVRQFNETVGQVFAATPTRLRSRAGRDGRRRRRRDSRSGSPPARRPGTRAPSTTSPDVPCRARGGGRRHLPACPAAAARDGHRGAHAGRDARPGAAAPRRPARPDGGGGALSPPPRPRCRSGRRRRPPATRPGTRARRSTRGRAFGCRARPTATRWRCGPCSASRSRSRPGWPSPRGWWRASGGTWTTPAGWSPARSRPPRPSRTRT